ncbi:MAG: G-D-S-L family lipolytic protein [Chitinophagaceae bacterium]|nr:MAG: G-D-S-L family lipolytic protein [Chitinophagaceae bacterium]
MKKRVYLFLLILITATQFACAQQPPFWNDILRFRQQDSVLAYPGQHPIISSLPDVIRYVNDVVIKHVPKQVVIYCGENDFAADPNLAPGEVAARFRQLFKQIRRSLPYARISYVSMKPSPSRTHLIKKFNVANEMIRDFLSKKKRTDYIDVYHAMLGADGAVLKDLFLEDNLHMNAKGYAIWQRIIAPYLVR